MNLAILLAWPALFFGCASSSPALTTPLPGRVPPERRVCGWKEHRGPVVGRADRPQQLTRALDAALPLEGELRWHVAKRLLRRSSPPPRLHFAVDGRWQVPVSVRSGSLPRPAPSAHVTIVGHHRIARPRSAPRVRLSSLRLLEDQRLVVFLEGDAPGGRSTPDLATALRAIEAAQPPAVTFLVEAEDGVVWSRIAAASVGLACVGRGPGEEPREVIWEVREPRTE